MTSSIIRTEVQSVNSLSHGEYRTLFELFQEAFQADERAFYQDLEAKDIIIRLWQDDTLLGFSSLGSFRSKEQFKIYYSGDTYVAPEARNGHALLVAWGRLVFSLQEESKESCFWLLLSSGFRTYRLISSFFHRFSPDGQDAQKLNTLRDQCARTLYGRSYRDGIVRLDCPSPLREPSLPPRLQRDERAQRFLQLNPGHAAGDELVSLIPLTSDNLTASGRRVLGRKA